jgi:hypothetical protein
VCAFRSVADDQKDCRHSGTVPLCDGANQRGNVLDWIQTRNRPHDERVVGDTELSPHACPHPDGGQPADVDAVVDHVHPGGGKAFCDEMPLQIGRHRDHFARRVR